LIHKVILVEEVDDIMTEENFNSTDSVAPKFSPHLSDSWIFTHHELFTPSDTDRAWDQKKLINRLNYTNFNDSYVFFLFTHTETGERVLTKAYPLPCSKNELVCRLNLPEAVSDPDSYNLEYLVIDDGISIVLSSVQLIGRENNLWKVQLPDRSPVKNNRKTKRYMCDDIVCKVVQGDFNARGQLIDFSPGGLGIRLAFNTHMKGFDESKPALINASQNGTKLFSGLCRCVRNGLNTPDSRIVFAPLNKQVSLFPKREMRNTRQHVAPSFSVHFRHPFFAGQIERDIFDISTAGFSVKDKIEEELLLPGMLISSMSIVYAGIIKMNCSAQVVYRQEDQENNMAKCGLAIADMDLQSFTHLNHILGVYNDNYARVSNEVEMNALWEFFFDTGFIYGEKYEVIQSYRESFKEAYRKLYKDNSDIARHFVYKKNGKIFGHIAMIHAYEPSWLIHHFAARRMSHRLPGMTVLKQIIQYTGSYNRLPSAGMDHVMTYYQPNNQIIDRIFGNFARDLNILKGSSLDTFSYLLFEKKCSPQELPEGWKLRDCGISDLAKLKEFYEISSGGLLLNALGLEIPSEAIKKSFARTGFKRDYQTYCLCYEDKQMAFFIVNQSDIKINLSDLINGIKIIILEPDIISWAMLSIAVSQLSVFYTEKNIPLLIFPSYYLSVQNIMIEKQYTLWILQAKKHSDDFLAYMNGLMKLKSVS
jgi:hypothetical protein